MLFPPLLCFKAISLKKYTDYAEESAHALCRFFLGFDGLQFSVDCPTAPALPARRVSRDLTLSREVR